MKISSKLKKIKLLILDVDGVLTDGKIYLSDAGIETKTFDVRDGLGLKMLLKHGIQIAVISGRKSKATSIRLRELKIKHVYLGAENKIKIYQKLKKALKIKDESIAYIGDDIIDLEVMKKAGLSVAVADATPKILEIADHILKNKGGNAAVREMCDLLLHYNTQPN